MDRSFRGFSEQNPYPVNLIAANPDQAEEFYRERGAGYFDHKYNIASWFWELSTFPEEWAPRFAPYQEVWVASQFTADSMARVSPAPVIKMIYPVCIDESRVAKDRAKFGLREDLYAFLFIFDYRSVIERKNVTGLLRAYRRAFKENDRVILILKSINSEHNPGGAERIRREAAGARVRMIDDHLSGNDVYSLIATCDCYVSLHRAEGLGLGMAQAMYFEKPVIATGYSGNLEFMNVNNSLLVKYDLIELGTTYGPYRRGSVWAEPDIDHAAELMRLVYEDRERASALGARAARDIRTGMSAAVAGQAARDRLMRVLEGSLWAKSERR
jgi:glycosyltransferase involved in cell wall biosynthesis